MNNFKLCIIVILLISTSIADENKIAFGICADVHKDIIPDANQRLQKFINTMNDEKVDFIVQLGDFCLPYEKNRDILEIWNSFDGSNYHVLGNHDMDGGFTREQTVKFMDMENRYYSFDQGNYHFIVLDGNDKSDPPVSGYPHDIGIEQQKWLQKDLDKTDKKVIIFSHQSLEDEKDGIVRRAKIRKVLENAKTINGRQKVIACFSGHHHFDYYRRINGIYYIQTNSMAYQWVGSDFAYNRYDEKIEKQFPHVSSIAPYTDALFASVMIDNEAIHISGVESKWMSPSPWEIGYDHFDDYHKNVPKISSQTLFYSKEKMEQTPEESPHDFFAWVTIEPKSAVFEENQKITLSPSDSTVEILYSLNGKRLTNQSPKYDKPITLNESNILSTAAFLDGKMAGIISKGNYVKVQKIQSIKLNSNLSEKYGENGKHTLIDMQRGSGDFNDGQWIGFEGNNLDAVLDLGKKCRVNKLHTGFLKNNSAWIFLPESIEVYTSKDGRRFKKINTITGIKSNKKLYNFMIEIDKKNIRYIQIIAKNIRTCPKGHPGENGKAWMFVDEIYVE